MDNVLCFQKSSSVLSNEENNVPLPKTDKSIKFKKNEYGSSSEELTIIRSCDIEKVHRSRNLKPNLDQNKRHSSGSFDNVNKETKLYFEYVRGPLRDLLSRGTLLQMVDAAYIDIISIWNMLPIHSMTIEFGAVICVALQIRFCGFIFLLIFLFSYLFFYGITI